MRRNERGGKKLKTKEKEDLSLVLSTLNSAKAEIEEVQTNKERLAAETETAALSREKAVKAKIKAKKELEVIEAQIVERQHEFEVLNYKTSVSQNQLQENLKHVQNLLEQERELRLEQSGVIQKVQQEINDLKQVSEKELADLEAKKKVARDNTDNLAKQKATLDLILEELRGESLKEEEKIAFLEKRIESLNVAIDRLWDEFSSVQETVKTEKVILGQVKNEVLEKEKELDSVKIQLTSAIGELNDIKLRIVGGVDREKELRSKELKLQELYKESGLILKV